MLSTGTATSKPPGHASKRTSSTTVEVTGDSDSASIYRSPATTDSFVESTAAGATTSSLRSSTHHAQHPKGRIEGPSARRTDSEVAATHQPGARPRIPIQDGARNTVRSTRTKRRIGVQLSGRI